MTRLRELKTVRPGLYRLPEDSVATEVLIPCFGAARKVRGAFGWFSAGWISGLAPGLAVFLNRGSSLPIEFTVAPAFFEDELKAAERGIAALKELKIGFVFHLNEIGSSILYEKNRFPLKSMDL